MFVIASQSNHAYIGEMLTRDGDVVVVTDAYQVSHLDGARVSEAWIAAEGIGEPRMMCVSPRLAEVYIYGVTAIIEIGRDAHVKIAATLRDLEEFRRMQREQ